MNGMEWFAMENNYNVYVSIKISFICLCSIYVYLIFYTITKRRICIVISLLYLGLVFIIIKNHLPAYYIFLQQ